MAKLQTPQISTRTISYGLVDIRGQKRSTSIRIGNNVFAGGELGSLGDAMGAITNAGVYRETETFDRETAIIDALAADDAESSVNTVLVVTLQNNSGDKLSFTVPAPDVSVLSQDRSQLIIGDAGAVAGTPEKLAATFRTALVNAVNNSYTPANSYSIIRTFVSSYKGRGSRNTFVLPSEAEGGSGDTPPSAPV